MHFYDEKKLTERKVFATFQIYFDEALPGLPLLVDVVNKHLCNNGALLFGFLESDKALNLECCKRDMYGQFRYDNLTYMFSIYSVQKKSITCIEHRDKSSLIYDVPLIHVSNALYVAQEEYNTLVSLEYEEPNCYVTSAKDSLLLKIHEPERSCDLTCLSEYFKNEVYSERNKE